MDEIEILASHRADPVPSENTVARHRRQLRALIDASDGATYASDANPRSAGDGTNEREVAAGIDTVHLRPEEPPGDRRRRRAVRGAVAAAVLAVVAGAGAVAVLRADGDNGRDPAAAGPQAPVGTGWPGCGADAPIGFIAPNGYEGPVIGSSPDATRVATAEQCALHWTSPTGSIDVRFPVDPEFVPDAQALCEHLLTNPKEDRGFKGYGEDLPPGAAPSGRDRYADLFVMRRDADGSCPTMQIVVYHDDLARAREAERVTWATAYDPQVPLVRESRGADRIPEVHECPRDAGGEPELPNWGGPVTDLGAEAAPADALRAFLETQARDAVRDNFMVPGSEMPPVLLPLAVHADGFIELTLPDGSIAYTADYDGVVSAVIHAVPTADGWTIESWEASGNCPADSPITEPGAVGGAG